jgi:hypothetical protein
LCELRVGDRLLGEKGDWLVIEALEDTGTHETVYNLRVADFHTYFVGCEEWGWSVWAHNAIYGHDAYIDLEDQAILNHPELTPEMAAVIIRSRALHRELADDQPMAARGNRRQIGLAGNPGEEDEPILYVSGAERVDELHGSLSGTNRPYVSMDQNRAAIDALVQSVGRGVFKPYRAGERLIGVAALRSHCDLQGVANGKRALGTRINPVCDSCESVLRAVSQLGDGPIAVTEGYFGTRTLVFHEGEAYEVIVKIAQGDRGPVANVSVRKIPQSTREQYLGRADSELFLADNSHLLGISRVRDGAFLGASNAVENHHGVY